MRKRLSWLLVAVMLLMVPVTGHAYELGDFVEQIDQQVASFNITHEDWLLIFSHTYDAFYEKVVEFSAPYTLEEGQKQYFVNIAENVFLKMDCDADNIVQYATLLCFYEMTPVEDLPAQLAIYREAIIAAMMTAEPALSLDSLRAIFDTLSETCEAQGNALRMMDTYVFVYTGDPDSRMYQFDIYRPLL